MFADVISLCSTRGYNAAHKAHMHAMVSSYRFVNSEHHFDSRAVTMLLRLLASNSCEEREKWYIDILFVVWASSSIYIYTLYFMIQVDGDTRLSPSPPAAN
jgi:hypothetical protein